MNIVYSDPSKNTNDAAGPSWTFPDDSPEKKQKGRRFSFEKARRGSVGHTYVHACEARAQCAVINSRCACAARVMDTTSQCEGG